jgi:hypothetical protein
MVVERSLTFVSTWPSAPRQRAVGNSRDHLRTQYFQENVSVELCLQAYSKGSAAFKQGLRGVNKPYDRFWCSIVVSPQSSDNLWGRLIRP